LAFGQLLGEGGFAQVFEVTRHPLSLFRIEAKENKYVHGKIKLFSCPRFAVKVVRQELLHHQDRFRKAADDLVNEARILSMLDHPNIIKLRALSSHSVRPLASENRYDEFFLVTDRLRETLATRIDRWKNERTLTQSLLTTQKLSYALQLAQALQYLHSRNILMRDVKPDNIGFINDHTLQLFDFGLSRQLSTLKENCKEGGYQITICGTLRYLPKEVLVDGRHTLKFDVYSFAMVFWEMLTHEKPFHYMTPAVHRILVCERGERPPLGKYGFPQHIRNLLNLAWADRVEDRLSINQVCDQLHWILQTKVGASTKGGDAASQPLASRDCNKKSSKFSLINANQSYEEGLEVSLHGAVTPALTISY